MVLAGWAMQSRCQENRTESGWGGRGTGGWEGQGGWRWMLIAYRAGGWAPQVFIPQRTIHTELGLAFPLTTRYHALLKSGEKIKQEEEKNKRTIESSCTVQQPACIQNDYLSMNNSPNKRHTFLKLLSASGTEEWEVYHFPTNTTLSIEQCSCSVITIG